MASRRLLLAATLAGALVLSGCRSDPERGPELARFLAIDHAGETIGRASLYASKSDPALIIEDVELRNEKGRIVLVQSCRLDKGRLAFSSRTRFMRTVEELELEVLEGVLLWRKKVGLSISRSEMELEDPVLLAWPLAPHDGLVGSIALWSHLAGRLVADESERRLTAFNIRRGRAFDLFVSHRESREVRVGEEARRAHRFFVSTRASGHVVWVDAASNELLFVDNVLGVKMVREGFEVPPLEREPLPASVVAEDLTLRTGDVELAATLTLPEEREGPVPVVILVHGSGPQDRDQSPLMVFRHLAHDLGEAGIAVLRYDKRGVGESRFLGEERDVELRDFAADAGAWIDVLERRPEIDPSRIVIAGHSEGGYIAPLLASQDPRVAGVVMLAGPADPLLEIMAEQALLIGEAHGMNEGEIDEMVRLQSALLKRVRSDFEPSEDDEEIFAWLRSHHRHDPKAVLRALEVPLLAVFARGDLQVPVGQADRLASIAEEKEPGMIRIEILDGIDHALMDDRDGRGGLGLLMDPDRRLDPRVPRLIARWLGEE